MKKFKKPLGSVETDVNRSQDITRMEKLLPGKKRARPSHDSVNNFDIDDTDEESEEDTSSESEESDDDDDDSDGSDS